MTCHSSDLVHIEVVDPARRSRLSQLSYDAINPVRYFGMPVTVFAGFLDHRNGKGDYSKQQQTEQQGHYWIRGLHEAFPPVMERPRVTACGAFHC